MITKRTVTLAAFAASFLGTAALRAANDACAGLPPQATLRQALQSAQNKANGGFGLNMWRPL